MSKQFKLSLWVSCSALPASRSPGSVFIVVVSRLLTRGFPSDSLPVLLKYVPHVCLGCLLLDFLHEQFIDCSLMWYYFLIYTQGKPFPLNRAQKSWLEHFKNRSSLYFYKNKWCLDNSQLGTVQISEPLRGKHCWRRHKCSIHFSTQEDQDVLTLLCWKRSCCLVERGWHDEKKRLVAGGSYDVGIRTQGAFVSSAYNPARRLSWTSFC